MTGAVVGSAGISMLVAAMVSVIYQEWSTAGWIVLAALITTAIGFALWKLFGLPGELSTREGFAAVALAWMAIGLLGSLPYLLTGSITNVTDAVFETVAGFTTTGSSVVPDPAALPHGILFWRSFTQWLGGMGIIVLSIAILPLLGMGAVQLARAESPGPTPDRLTPRFKETAKRLWIVYFALTGAQTLLLWLGDMNLFDAVNHSLTTLSTGGFSTNAGSLGAFTAYSQWVVIVFMILAGTSFAVHYRAIRMPGVYWRTTEVRVYLGVMGAAAAVMAIGTWGGPVHEVIRDAIFAAATLITTTGYGTADFGLWKPALQIMIVGLMFVGGMAGSTSGSIKIYRHEILFGSSRADVRRLIHPRGVFVTRIGKAPVKDTIVEAVQTFFMLYMFAFMTGSFALAVISSIWGPDLDIISTVSAVASSIGNVGPGLGSVGPTGNYLEIAALGKWLLAGLMIIGRLEILPILILFSRESWRR
ncbi:MAG: TrkH family potassium uptake protein [Actinomycetota bacterium]|nr:TrkH family potassium uptake protein [Actinomycetota bacterium]